MQKRNSKDINKVENEVKDIKKEVDSKKMEEENNQDDQKKYKFKSYILP